MEKRLEAFADHSLDKLHESMGSEDHDIAGVPLQCMLIGEVLRSEAMNYADPDNVISDMPPSIEIGSITELYQRLVEVKLDKYSKREDSNKFTREQLLDAHIDLSVKLLFPRLGENVTKTEASGPTIQQEDLLNVGLVELVSGEEDELAFIHRTIPEFFVTLHAIQFLGDKEQDRWFGGLVDYILESDSDKEDIFTRCASLEATHHFKHPVIMYFLDSLIGQDPGTQLQFTVKAIIDLRSLARSCVNGGRKNIFMYFHSSFNEQARSVFDKHLVRQSVKCSSLEMTKHVCETYEKVNEGDRVRDIRIREETTVLDVAVGFGMYSVVEYLVNCHGFRELIEGGHPSIRSLIHYCVESTSDIHDALAHERVHIVKFLHHLNKRLLEYRNAEDQTPLLCYGVHKQLLIELMPLGANFLAVDTYNDTVLHKAPYYFSAKNYHELVTNIPRQVLVNLLQMKGRDNYTALHAILKTKSPAPCTFQLFKDLGADFNAITRDGMSVFDIAILKHRSVDVLQRLVIHGADWRRWNQGKQAWTHLHEALRTQNFEALKYLSLKIAEDGVDELNTSNIQFRECSLNNDPECLDNVRKILLDANGWADLDKVDLRVLGIDVNVEDSDVGSSLFEYVVRTKMNDEDKYEIAKLLLRSGGIPTIPEIKFVSDDLKLSREMLALLETQGVVGSEKDAGNFLRCIANSTTSGEQETYEEFADRVLVKWPLALNNKGDLYPNTPLHDAVAHINGLGATYWLRKGADVNARNWFGATPLHHAIGHSYRDPIDMVRLLAENGADLTALDKKNRTPLQLARAKLFTQTIEYLISKGA